MAEVIFGLFTAAVGLVSYLLGMLVERKTHRCKVRVVRAARVVDQKVQPDLPRRARRDLARRR